MADTINSNPKNALGLLKMRRLTEALEYLSEQAQECGNLDLRTQIDSLQTNYSMLLQYFANGSDDPSRQEQLDAIFAKAWAIYDQLTSLQNKRTDAYLSDTLSQQMIESFAHSSLTGEEQDLALGILFNRIKACLPISSGVRRSLHEFMLDEQQSSHDRAVILSAITLNLLQRFDAEMLENVYTYTLDDQPLQIRVQAHITLVLCGIKYDTRIRHDHRLSELYRMMVEAEGDFLTAMQVVMIQCPLSKVFRKQLTNIIRVEIGKANSGQPHMSLLDIMKMLNDGVDHDYDNFKKLSKSLAFFKQPEYEHHWLMPFSLENYWIKSQYESHPNEQTAIKLMVVSETYSNASKYLHFNLIAKNLPELIEKIRQQVKELPPQVDYTVPLSEFIVMRNYLHDLYRYLSISRWGRQIDNLLDHPCDFNNVQCLREETENPDRLEEICRLLFKKKYWKEACVRLRRLTRQRITSELLGMLATAAEEANENVIAREALLRQMSLYNTDEAIYLRLAKLYDKDAMYIDEETKLHEALKQFAGSVPLKLQMLHCLNQQGRWSEALAMLSRLEAIADPLLANQKLYLQAYAYLALGQASKADECIEECISEKDIADDAAWCLAIITALCTDQISKATERFRYLTEDREPQEAYSLLVAASSKFKLTHAELSSLCLLDEMNR